jgi:hypothetical protein
MTRGFEEGREPPGAGRSGFYANCCANRGAPRKSARRKLSGRISTPAISPRRTASGSATMRSKDNLCLERYTPGTG